MKKITKLLAFSFMVLFTCLLINPQISKAAELTTAQTDPGFWKCETENDENNKILYNDASLLDDAGSYTTASESFSYDFENYVDVGYEFSGTACSKIKFELNTTTWSGLNNFAVEMYKIISFLPDTLENTKYVYKSNGAGASITFELTKGTNYKFRFANSSSNYGKQIVGSGKWTLTYR